MRRWAEPHRPWWGSEHRPWGLIYKGLSACKCCRNREEMFHRQRDLYKKNPCRKKVQFYASFHPGVKVPQSLTNGKIRRRPQEVGGGNAPYRVAYQLSQKKNTFWIPNTHRSYHVGFILFIINLIKITHYEIWIKEILCTLQPFKITILCQTNCIT